MMECWKNAMKRNAEYGIQKTVEKRQESLITKTRRYENTKEEGGYIEQSALFRAFQVSCFRDEVLGFYSVFSS